MKLLTSIIILLIMPSIVNAEILKCSSDQVTHYYNIDQIGGTVDVTNLASDHWIDGVRYFKFKYANQTAAWIDNTIILTHNTDVHNPGIDTRTVIYNDSTFIFKSTVSKDYGTALIHSGKVIEEYKGHCSLIK